MKHPQLSDEVHVRIRGHLKINEYVSQTDLQTGNINRVLLNQSNAVHPENLSIVIARGLADRPDGSVYTMAFGTGGATVDPLGNIIFATPNTTGAADLNHPVFFKVVDDQQGAETGNYMAVRHINGTLFSDVEIHCVLDQNEPFGQPAFDNVGILNLNRSNFVFSEIGLKSQDNLLLTHVVFSPVEKSANRILEIIYTLRIRITSG